MKSKKVLKDIIKSRLIKMAEEYGFSFYKPTTIIKCDQSILQIINFDILIEGFNCSIAIQPLYIPSEGLDMSFGNRLNYFNVVEQGIWGEGDNKNKIEADVDKCLELIKLNVIPWFEKLSTPDEIILFINSEELENKNLIAWFPPQLRNKFLGFSYLYTGKHDLAENVFNHFIKFYEDDDRNWVINDIKIVNKLISVSKANPLNIPKILDEYVEFTKRNLKINL